MVDLVALGLELRLNALGNRNGGTWWRGNLFPIVQGLDGCGFVLGERLAWLDLRQGRANLEAEARIWERLRRWFWTMEGNKAGVTCRAPGTTAA